METGLSCTKNKDSRKLIVILIVLLVVVAAMAGVITVLAMRGKEKSNDEPKRNVVINESNVKEVVSQLAKDEYTPVGAYEVTMNSTWNFENGSSASDNAYVKNSVSNTNSVYFDVMRSDTKETIMESPVLPVGTYLDNITLDKNLKAGTYDCVCTYYMLDDNQKPVREVSLTLTINIRN